MFGDAWLPKPPNIHTHSPDALPFMGVIMSLRNQPYLPLYVNDVLTDEKLAECSATSRGVYLFLLCFLHKQESYGVLTIKDKYKEPNSSKEDRFAKMLSRHLPDPVDVIKSAITELAKEGVIDLTEDELSQKRMIRDFQKSLIRIKSGSKSRSKK